MKKLMMALMMTHQRMKRWICVLIMMAMMTVTPNEEFSCYSYREDFLRKNFLSGIVQITHHHHPNLGKLVLFYPGYDEGPPPPILANGRKKTFSVEVVPYCHDNGDDDGND